ncbi:MAG: DEAD/DEAH box helicase family protein [Verrucomicrobia bacterium]|nr:DEAD/DEAH box helicase family protein [Verrucomicrobiota bacterium]
MPSEAQARITINKMLEEAGWRFLPDSQGRRENIVCEHRVTRRAFSPSQDLGKDFEHAPQGFVDYVHLHDDQRPVAVTEAKREDIDPLTGKEQARSYAEGLKVSHIFLSNGLVHYYWNLRQGNPVKVSRFLPLEQLGKAAEWRPDAARLAAVTVDENYIAVSQDAAWLSYSPADREVVRVNKKIRLLRDYQVDGMRALQKAASPSLHHFLFEMATGTGKTLLSAAIAKLYLRTENATRILFLVDRLELENQAWKNFNAYLANDGIQTVIYKQKRRDWMQAQVVVTTIQSLAARNRFLHEFAPTDFQLIISDEAHRTISGNNRAIFEYFVGAKLGLTATPRDYLKGLKDTDRQNDPREYERRLLLDTYRTFGSDDGQPTFRYTLLNAVQHAPPYLCNPVTLDARTDITTQMLSDEGYAVTVPANEDGQEQELVFGKRAYERKFFSDETNLSFVRCFLDHAKCDPITGETGKTILFAVSRKHATKLVTLLNEEATRRWPKEYAAGSTFAVQVTSDIPGAQQMTIDFANNNLNGKSKWRADDFRDYDTSRTRVCVTVGMMTTGYDCEDLLNVALARPIFSPTDFIQIKGRGTRLFTFKHGEGASGRTAKKDGFALFDFFANCEYFEEDFDYDQKLSLPKGPPEEGGGGGGGGGIRIEDFINTSLDPMASVIRDEIGLFGMRIDREMYRERFAQQASEAVASDAVLRQAYDDEDWPAVEERVRRLLFEKPQEFWNLPKLQEIYKSDRLPSLREILARVFGLIPEIPTRSQLADEAFERFVATQPTNAVHSRELKVVFVAFLLDEGSRFLLQEGKFAELRARDASLYGSLSQLSPEEREALIGYLQSQVQLKDFEGVA